MLFSYCRQSHRHGSKGETEMKKDARPYKYVLIQDGLVVASVESSSKEQAEKEINHYALVYSQDGPVEIKNRGKKK